MKRYTISLLTFFTIIFSAAKSNAQKKDSDTAAINKQRSAEKFFLQQKEQQLVDSMVTVQLQKELALVSSDTKKKELQDRLQEIMKTDSARKAGQLKKIAELKQHATGYPVVLLRDTLFYLYTSVGSFSAADRAAAISGRIEKLYEDAGFKADSLEAIQNETNYDIVYDNHNTIMSVANLDALWFNLPQDSLANKYLLTIKKEVTAAKEANSFYNWVKRIGYSMLILLSIGVIIFIVNRLFKRSAKTIQHKKEQYFAGLAIKKIQLLSAQQHVKLALRANNILRVVVIILAIYFALPPFFNIFPQTRFFANLLWAWVTTPAKAVFDGVVAFLPNLFTIAIIYIVFRYLVKLVKYFATEIDRGSITLSGFHSDWAAPTFNIIRFIIYAFMFVIIFPYLPGSQSPAFQGVSVFLGLLISLGSSSAISNIVSGLVITYMRPFKIGDRVKIGDITGDVLEKTMLVTRIRTIKNEDITVPNSTVLNSHTINYSANTNDTGLIIHTTVTIGYDVPWKDIHQALIDAALKTELVLNKPLPFVLQTSLDDFYVSYQINAYTREANKQAAIYSKMHQNIQDVCNERGIEIMSPHYNAMRDGNTTTIPPNYLTKDYKPAAFNVNLEGDTNSKIS